MILGQWNFSEGTGTTTADLSGNGRTLTVNDWGEPHNTGFSAATDGSARAVGMTGDLGLNAPAEIGLTVWANLQTPSGNPDIITIKDATEASYVGVYWGDSSHIRLYILGLDGNYRESSLIAIPIGAWIHYGIAVNATSCILYLNGSAVATLSRSAAFGDLITFNLGGSEDSSGQHSIGLFFDATLYDNAPTQSDVYTQMHTPINHTPVITPTTPTIAWAADEGTGTTVTDFSGNGNTGVAASNGWVTGHSPHAFAAAGNSTSPAVELESVTDMPWGPTMTYMGLVKAITYTGSGDLLEIKSDHSSTRYLTIWRPSISSLLLEIKDLGGVTTDTVEYPYNLTGVWVHLAARVDVDEISLFIDGELAVTVPRTSATNLGPLKLLYAGGTDTKFNQAAVNDVRLFGGALDNDTIRYYANTPVTALTMGTIGPYADNYADTSFTVGVPSGVTVGALVCAAVIVYGSDLTPPSITGFTLSKSSPSVMTAFGLNFKVFWFYKYATSADSGTYTISKGANQVNAAYVWRLIGWTGSSDPYADTLHEGVNDSGPAVVSSFTPGGESSMLISIALQDTSSVPTGWVKDATATSRDGDTINLGHIVQDSPTATGSLAFGSTEGVVSIATIRQSTPSTDVLGLNLGANNLKKLMLGSQEIKKAYIGSSLVYDRT